MPYTPTVWKNDQAPALSAANLNKLTDELEAQAAEKGVAHSLPSWADGSDPAITSAAPLNEMERVISVISDAVGNPYTRTTWQEGWTPARNAARFNAMETATAANRSAIDTTPGAPSGYYWKGDFAADAQDFSAFDTHDIRFTTFNDWAVGSTKDAVIVNKPVGSRYPWSQYSCRIIANNDLPSNSSSGQTVNVWQTGAYGAPWTRGNTVWCRVFILLPNGTNPTYPGKLTPVPGDGVDNDFHVVAEWHKNDGAGAPGPTSTKLETSLHNGNPVWIFKPIGGLSGAVRQKYAFETNQVQGPANGVGGGTGPIGGTPIPIQFNRWYDMLFRWKLDPDPNVGEIDWYVDGNLRVSGKYGNMFQRSDGVVPAISFQAGLYRSYPFYEGRGTDTTDENEHVYIGPMLAGPTRASVGA